jgi:hypothetical protein
MEEFRPGGRIAMFPANVRDWIASDVSGLCLGKQSVGLLVLAVFFLLANGKQAFVIPQELCFSVVAGTALFVGAHIILPKLYMPAKYIGMPFLIALIFVVAFNASRYMMKLNFFLRLVFGVLLCSCIIFYQVCFVGIAKNGERLSDTQKALFSYLATLPPQSLIAGHPTVMNNAHIFSRRKVFITEELSMPFHKEYYTEISKRTVDFFRAYYADSEEELRMFCLTYGITHIVIDTAHFDTQYISGKNFYLNPYNEYITNLVAQRKRYILKSWAEKEAIFVNKGVVVVKVPEGG